ncbi:MAG: alpha/beta fold hydrolase [Candidatus Kapaibacterium sp.]
MNKPIQRAGKAILFGFLVLLVWCNSSSAQPNSELSESELPSTEEILHVRSHITSDVEFEVTVFTPTDSLDAHAPIVIINHGSNPKPGQLRERAISPTKFFLSLHYTVILPMRRGYAGSSGRRVKIKDCNLTEYGLANASDIDEVVQWLQTQDRFKGRKIIMIGQSTGGLATMAYSSLSSNIASAIINFHGGVRPSLPEDCLWQARLDAFAQYGKTSRPTSLWFYTANDHSSNPEFIRKLYAAFSKNGGEARVMQLSAFKHDGHFLFGDPDGGPTWQPVVIEYLTAMHLLAPQNR